MLRRLVVAVALALAAGGAVASVAGSAVAQDAPKVSRSAWFKYAPWNSDLAEVKKTGTGLEYVVIASGAATGKSPTMGQSAKMYYEGRLNSGGRAFDSSFQRGAPDTYEVAILVPGFREALTLMKPGDRWLVYIPAALAYAERGYPGLIGPDENLLFEIWLQGVE